MDVSGTKFTLAQCDLPRSEFLCWMISALPGPFIAGTSLKLTALAQKILVNLTGQQITLVCSPMFRTINEFFLNRNGSQY